MEQQLSLCAPSTEKEIKVVVFSILSTKSPGPDGFSSGFFKATWLITGRLVIEAIQHFLDKTYMPTFMGETKLVMLPKVPNPT